MADVLVYSAVFGNYDEVREPLEPGRYRLYTDGRAPWGWKEYHQPPTNAPRKMARWWKVAGMPTDAMFTVWLDGCLQLLVEPDLLVQKWLIDERADIALFAHPVRDCLYQEAKVVKSKAKDFPATVDAQMERYAVKGFPRHFGLGETPVLVRRNTPAVRAFNLKWWRELEEGSLRDQLSFDYVRWLMGDAIKVNLVDGGGAWRRRQHDWVRGYPHGRKG